MAPSGTTAGAPRPQIAELTLRPIARAYRIALIEREVRERLSRAALDAVLTHAEVISEGQRSERNGQDSFMGSTMLTIDMGDLESILREPPDAGTAHRLVTLLRADASIKARIDALAGREVHRVTATRPKSVRTEFQIRSQGVRVFIDADVEATF